MALHRSNVEIAHEKICNGKKNNTRQQQKYKHGNVGNARVKNWKRSKKQLQKFKRFKEENRPVKNNRNGKRLR